MRIRVTPAGERLGQGMVTRRLQPLHERLAGAVIELVALGHYLRLRVREPHQVCIKRDHGQTIVCAIPRNHRGGGGGIKLGAWLCKIAIETRLRLRSVIAGAISEYAERGQRQQQTIERHSRSSPNQQRDLALRQWPNSDQRLTALKNVKPARCAQMSPAYRAWCHSAAH